MSRCRDRAKTAPSPPTLIIFPASGTAAHAPRACVALKSTEVGPERSALSILGLQHDGCSVAYRDGTRTAPLSALQLNDRSASGGSFLKWCSGENRPYTTPSDRGWSSQARTARPPLGDLGPRRTCSPTATGPPPNLGVWREGVHRGDKRVCYTKKPIRPRNRLGSLQTTLTRAIPWDSVPDPIDLCDMLPVTCYDS